jgi:hypothetical protein
MKDVVSCTKGTTQRRAGYLGIFGWGCLTTNTAGYGCIAYLYAFVKGEGG